MIAFAPICRNRPASYLTETNDCTVWALMACTGIDYAVSHEVLRSGGRRDRKGPSWNQWRSILTKYNFSEVPGIPKHCTLAYALSRLPKQGRFICDVRGHTFAVIDGVVRDYKPGARRRVWAMWKFNGTVKEEQQPVNAPASKPPIKAEKTAATRWDAVWNWKF